MFRFLLSLPGRINRNPIASCGYFLLAYLIVREASLYGTNWVLGKYYMPRSLVAADGLHYPNGEVIDPLTLSLIRSGNEEIAYLILLAIPAIVLPALFFWNLAKIKRYQKEWDAIKQNAVRRTKR